MHYCVYLDEFGHVGPYVSSDDPRFNDHPIFGLGGLAIPSNTVRQFSTFFYQQKGNLLRFEIEKAYKECGTPQYLWEKKGSQLFTLQNVKKYQQLRRTTNRILNKIEKCGGFIFYVGQAKKRNPAEHDPKKTYHYMIKETLKRLQQEFEQRNSTFHLILDEHTERASIYASAATEMFSSNITRLVEPPFEVDSKLYQTTQCADWICGLVGRLSYYECEPDVKPDWELFERYFKERVDRVQKRSSIRNFDRPKKAKLDALVQKFGKN